MSTVSVNLKHTGLFGWTFICTSVETTEIHEILAFCRSYADSGEGTSADDFTKTSLLDDRSASVKDFHRVMSEADLPGWNFKTVMNRISEAPIGEVEGKSRLLILLGD